MGRRAFPYGKHQFILNSVLFVVLTLAMVIILAPVGGSTPLTLITLVAIGGSMTVVLGLSPLFTHHSLEDEALILRQGLYFRAEIPYTEMVEVRRLERGPIRTGVYSRVMGTTLFVTTRRDDLIEVRLREARSFKWALGKRADRVVFDTEDNRGFLRALEERTGLTPSSQDLLS